MLTIDSFGVFFFRGMLDWNRLRAGLATTAC
jgi:hypothetical protein